VKRSAILTIALVALMISLASAVPGPNRRAVEATERFIDRALIVGSSDLVPKEELQKASVGEALTVHDPISLEPSYTLTKVHAADGTVLGLVAIDAGSGRFLWCRLNLDTDRYPPVSGREALGKLQARSQQLLIGDAAEQPILVEGYDKHLYWRFRDDDEAWLVPATRADAPVLSSMDGSIRRATTRERIPRTSRDLGGSGGRDIPDLRNQPILTATNPASYVIPAMPYHFQITDWYCGPAALQMIMDWLGQEVGQHNIADVANDVVGMGTYSDDMRRAAHFSGRSVAIQDPSLQGYTERQLGYACMAEAFLTNQGQRLKNTVYAQFPVFTLTWYSGAHSAGHYRVVKGFDDSLDVFVIDDPWYAGTLCGPDLLIDQTFFVSDLWAYSGHWCMVVTPWLLRPTAAASVAEGDTFTVDLKVLYPGPTRFGNQYLCTSCEATISLSSGLALAGGSPTVALADMASGDSTSVSWDVVAVGPPGAWGMAFQSQGILSGSSGSYPSYNDSIGGHAYSTVTVGSTLLAGWEPEERLTSDSTSSETCLPGSRAMAVSDDGTVHLVWADTRDDNSEIYYRSCVGGTWGAEVRLTTDPGHSHRPCIAEAPDGGLHVAWVDRRDGNYEIYYKSWDSVGGWSADERVTSYGEVDYNPAIAACDTAVFVAWERRMGSAFLVAAVHFAWRGGLGWSGAIDVDVASARDSYRPSLAYGPEGLLHIAYERQTSNNPDEKEKVVHKSWDGAAWSGRTGLSTDLSFSRNPSIATGLDSTVHVVWQDGENTGGDIFYARYDGVVWQPAEQIVTGGTEAGTPSVAVDGSGKIYVAWADNRNGESEIYAVTQEDLAWGDEMRVSLATGASVSPTVAVNAAGQGGIVWTDLRHGQADLYFRATEDQSGVIAGPLVPGSNLRLSAPYPMPFAGETRFTVTLGRASDVSLEVFDVRGTLVRRLFEDSRPAGVYDITWDGRSDAGLKAAPGVYFISGVGTVGRDTRRVVLIR
jgi:hypothetical protein